MFTNLQDSEAKILTCFHAKDNRGSFQKLFQQSWFSEFQDFSPKESYISNSKPNVLRGFHLQVNESSHRKLCSCLKGKVLDVIVDLRVGINFGKTYSTVLDSKKHNAIFIPKGYGHAFLNISKEDADVIYFVETEHNQNHDVGVLWNSVNFEWPINEPILSERDKLHPSIKNFSPI